MKKIVDLLQLEFEKLNNNIKIMEDKPKNEHNEEVIVDLKQQKQTYNFLFETLKNNNIDETIKELKKQIKENNVVLKTIQNNYNFSDKKQFKKQKATYRKYFFQNVIYKNVMKLLGGKVI